MKLHTSLLFSTILIGAICCTASGKTSTTIVRANDASRLEKLAASEVRRYVYLRTGELLPIVESSGKLPDTSDLIVISSADRALAKAFTAETSAVEALTAQQYIVKTMKQPERKALLIAGGDPVGTLYGAYRFVETLGVRFYVHGDTIPDEKIDLKLDGINEIGKPQFNLRGIQPFHNFPAGPTLWDRDNYMAIIGQLPKMRMNFIGFHSYTKAHPWRRGPAPELWRGLKEDINPDGTVKFSSHSTHDEHTLSGMRPHGTDRFSYGASQVFPRNLYASDLYEDLMPTPKTDEERNAAYNRSGALFNKAFTFANSLGVKTCMGSELYMPLANRLEKKLKSQGKDPSDPNVRQELYEGVFERIKRTHPLDYFWLWTNEHWTWKVIKEAEVNSTVVELKAAMRALENVDAPFTLGTSGWVMGPLSDLLMFDKILKPGMFVSCINRKLGREPVDPTFARVKNRPKWAMPWFENDLSMNSPQLWVGRIRKDAVDAKKYGCTGLFGLHWRTRIIGPTISALAQAGWDQKQFTTGLAIEKKHPVSVIGGKAYNSKQNIEGTKLQSVFKCVRAGTMNYRIDLPNKEYKVTFQMVEPSYDISKRSFSVELEGKKVIDKLDIFTEAGKSVAYERTFKHIQVTNECMEIKFLSHKDNACIAGIVIEEHSENLGADDQPVLMQINCGATAAAQGYIPDVDSKTKIIRYLATDDFYLDWAKHQFGPKPAKAIADIFTRIDANLPVVSNWGPGPGAIKLKPYDEQLFTFVDELAALQSQVKGPGNRDRFSYWLNEFRYLRSMAKVSDYCRSINLVMRKIQKEENAEEKIRIAREEGLPLREKLVKEWGVLITLKLSTLTTTGGMGDLINLVEANRSIPRRGDKMLRELLGEEQVPELPKDYLGSARMFVPAIRTGIAKGEGLPLKVIVLGSKTPAAVTLNWRPLGTGKWQQLPVKHEARGVYRITLKPELIKGDFEYYLSAVTDNGSQLHFPATAPAINNSVIIMPSE